MKQISDAIDEMIQKAACRHAVAVETVLHTLVAAGFAIADLSYCHLPELGKELVVCQHTCVLVIHRTYEGAAIRITYRIYPDGRPGGWPELSFDPQ